MAAATMERRPSPKPKPYERPRGGPARAIADLMPEIGRTAFRKFGFVQSSVVSRWPEIVGERYAKVSSPESIRFPAGRKTAGVTVKEHLNAFAESKATERELRRIARDKSAHAFSARCCPCVFSTPYI